MTVVDTDALLALLIVADRHHNDARSILKALNKIGEEIALLPTTLAEFALVATYRIGRVKTQRAVEILARESYALLQIDEDLTLKAAQVYLQQTSKEESFFDCFVMAAAKDLHASCIFSFDQGYTKNGFLLAKDFLKNRSPRKTP